VFIYVNQSNQNYLPYSVKTIEAHKANAMQKLNMTGRVDIVRYAVLRGWLQDSG
jgi:DNA-binding CsgD family transcriptional regulator